jgi:hypothetical protein
MVSLTLSSILSILTLTAAYPTADPSALVPRQGGIATNQANCHGYMDSNFSFQWTIDTQGPAFASDYGQGLLDNLRGQCGDITSWGYTYYYWGGRAIFDTNTIIPGGCVENAVWLATNPTGAVNGLACVDNTVTKAELGG